MKCREFVKYVPDWLGGRLSEEQAARMEAHRRLCPPCDRAVESERQLRAFWQALPPLPHAPDFWPRVTERIAVPTPAPRFRFPRPLTVAFSAAAFGACCLWVRLHAVPVQGPIRTVLLPQPNSTVDESRVVQLVSELHQMPESASDTILTETQPYRQDERFILLGSQSR